jgi:RNA polymerase sigma-70 factor (ECF subfamily)
MPDAEQPLDLRSLVADHGEVLYRYAYRLTGSVADAEDLVQQTYLVAVGKMDQLRDPAAARGWLFAVLRHAWLKSKRRPSPRVSSELDLDISLLAVELPDHFAIEPDELLSALEELPDEFRLVLVSFYFEDCSYKQIAERLELPIGTVMSRLSRAKQYLRTRLLVDGEYDRQTQEQRHPSPGDNGAPRPHHASGKDVGHHERQSTAG